MIMGVLIAQIAMTFILKTQDVPRQCKHKTSLLYTTLFLYGVFVQNSKITINKMMEGINRSFTSSTQFHEDLL